MTHEMTDFEITEPGDYRTRDGRRVRIEHRGESPSMYPWIGALSGEPTSWATSGAWSIYRGGPHPRDIVGPWVEPFDASLTITIFEGTSYFATDGTRTCIGQTRAEAAEALFREMGEVE